MSYAWEGRDRRCGRRHVNLRFLRNSLSMSPLGIIYWTLVIRDDLSRKMLMSVPAAQVSEPASSVTWRANACHLSWFPSGFLNVFVLAYGTPDRSQKASPVGERKEDPVT